MWGRGGGTVPLQKRATTVHGQVTEVATCRVVAFPITSILNLSYLEQRLPDI